MGCLVTPFAPDPSIKSSDASRIIRCNGCFGYFNLFCEVSNVKWECSICGNKNFFSRQQVNLFMNFEHQIINLLFNA